MDDQLNVIQFAEGIIKARHDAIKAVEGELRQIDVSAWTDAGVKARRAYLREHRDRLYGQFISKLRELSSKLSKRDLEALGLQKVPASRAGTPLKHSGRP